MPIINEKPARHKKNHKAYKLLIALYLQYRIEIKVEDYTIYPTCCYLINQKMQIVILKTGTIN